MMIFGTNGLTALTSEAGGIKIKKNMKRSIKEQADHMLRIMTVDMSIDLWQTAMCAIAAVEEIIEAIREVADDDVITPIVIYWEKVKKELETHVSRS
jgi:hypothetical protein